MRKILNYKMLVIILLAMQPNFANATVIEFNNDGTTTIYEAIDYLSTERRRAKSIPSFKAVENNDFDKYINKSATKYGLDPKLIKSVITAESSFRYKAVSHAGAQGLMQLMPQTAKRFKVKNSFDPEQNIDGGSQYLKFLIKLFEGDLDLVLAAYNAGEGAVIKYKGIPPYRETIHYVQKVKNIYSRY